MSYQPTDYTLKTVSVFEHCAKNGLYPPDTEKVKVNEVVSRIAFFYEKMRNVVDFKEEHLLRKAAVKRILERVLHPGVVGEKVAMPMVQELIRAGYIENNALPQKKVLEAARVINRYQRLIFEVFGDLKGRDREKMHRWFFEIAACELDEILSPQPKQNAIVEMMYRSIFDDFVVEGESISAEEKNILIYIAILRAFLKADQYLVEYHLLKLYFPNWGSVDFANARKTRKMIVEVRDRIYSFVNHSLNRYFLVRVQKYTPYFIIIRDILEENTEEARAILSDSEKLEEAVDEASKKRYDELGARLKRSIIRSFIYLFLTKILIAIAVEVPVDFYLYGVIHYYPLVTNVLFHPIFLAVLVLSARKPDEKNTEKMIVGVKEIVYGYEPEAGAYVIKRATKTKGVGEVIFNTLYAVLFLLSFGGIVLLLRFFEFGWVSVGLFLFFLSIVSFFGIKIRNTSRELIVLDRKDSIFRLPLDLMVIPIIRVGRWLSLNFSRVNVFVFILDVIIEAPFKALIQVFEDWLSFVREKKEEIYRES